jgi:hypothetical protein
MALDPLSVSAVCLCLLTIAPFPAVVGASFRLSAIELNELRQSERSSKSFELWLIFEYGQSLVWFYYGSGCCGDGHSIFTQWKIKTKPTLTSSPSSIHHVATATTRRL